jgi:hypothetical protein
MCGNETQNTRRQTKVQTGQTQWLSGYVSWDNDTILRVNAKIHSYNTRIINPHWRDQK